MNAFMTSIAAATIVSACAAPYLPDVPGQAPRDAAGFAAAAAAIQDGMRGSRLVSEDLRDRLEIGIPNSSDT